LYKVILIVYYRGCGIVLGLATSWIQADINLLHKMHGTCSGSI